MTMEELTKFYKDKRVLVTGHTGFKGAWLSRILTLAGAKVTGYALEPPTDPSLFEIAGLEDTMELSLIHICHRSPEPCPEGGIFQNHDG